MVFVRFLHYSFDVDVVFEVDGIEVSDALDALVVPLDSIDVSLRDVFGVIVVGGVC